MLKLFLDPPQSEGAQELEIQATDGLDEETDADRRHRREQQTLRNELKRRDALMGELEKVGCQLESR